MLPLHNRIADQLNVTGGLNALLEWDGTVLDGFSVPKGVDKETLLNLIIMRDGTRALVHPDPVWMKDAIKIWSKMRLPIWQKLYDTTLLEYNPIHNYDRTEEHIDERKIDRDTTENTSYSESANSETSEGTTESLGSKHDVSAENAGDYQPDYRDSSDRDTQTDTDSSLDTDGSSSGKGTEKVVEKYTHKVTAFGNIGVTTSQQMVEDERRVVRYNIYDEIEQDFVKEFCLWVW